MTLLPTVPAFTPAKFIALTVAAVAIALATNGQARAQAHPLPTLLRPADALGQDNGTLTANFYFATSSTPVPPPHSPEPTAPRTPQPTHPIQRAYPPLAR